MVKNFASFYVLITISTLFAMFLSGCVRSGFDNEMDWSKLYAPYRNMNKIAIAAQEGRLDDVLSDVFYGHTLRIAASESFVQRAFLHRYVALFENIHAGSTVEVITYPNPSEDTLNRISVEFMAGQAPTIIHAPLVFYPNLPNFGFFADWMPLLEKHPHFDEDDWNINFLRSMQRDGRMLSFTASVKNFYVVANSRVPGLADAFYDRSSISFDELLKYFFKFNDNVNNLYFAAEFPVFLSRQFVLSNYFNYRERKVDFLNPGFITHLEQLDGIIIDWRVIPPFGWYDADLILSELVMFRFLTGLTDYTYFGMFYENTYFINPLPISDKYGRIIMAPPMYGLNNYGWLLNAGATSVEKAMATEFMLLMAAVFDERHQIGSPFFFQVPAVIPYSTWLYIGMPTVSRIPFIETQRIVQTRTQHVFTNFTFRHSASHAAERLIELHRRILYNELVPAFYAPRPVSISVNEILNEFFDGLILADEAAQRLQNRVTLMLIEQE